MTQTVKENGIVSESTVADDSGSESKTHFGFREVPVGEKASLVGQVFTSVADNYDLMNDMMSMGIHRLWKRHFVNTAGIRPGDVILDLAGGTGDITSLMAPKVGKDGLIVLADINAAMLRNGRDRMLDTGLANITRTAQVNAEALPFASNTFNVVTMAFGLRNVTEKSNALKSIFRTLKPGGRLLVLEFSKVQLDAMAPIYDWYSFKVLPKLGKYIAKDEDSYRYLAESIRQHPDQDTLKSMFSEAGFEMCKVHNLLGGMVAIHSGVKL